MAVESLFRSDLDKEGKLFATKAEADKHDRKLDLAEALGELISEKADFSNDREITIENIAMLMAENKDTISKGMKGKPDLIRDLLSPNDEASDEASSDEAESSAAPESLKKAS